MQRATGINRSRQVEVFIVLQSDRKETNHISALRLKKKKKDTLNTV